MSTQTPAHAGGLRTFVAPVIIAELAVFGLMAMGLWLASDPATVLSTVVLALCTALAGTAAGVAVGAYLNRLRRQHGEQLLALSVRATVWRNVANRVAVGPREHAAQHLIAAAWRLLSTPPLPQAPLFPGGATDRLPAEARTIRLYGRIRSGKSLCAKRIIRQAIADGRHVTVIGGSPQGWQPGAAIAPGTPNEYDPEVLGVDPEQLTIAWGWECKSDRAISDLVDRLRDLPATAREVVVVDPGAGIAPADYAKLVTAIDGALNTRHDPRTQTGQRRRHVLVCLTAEADGLDNPDTGKPVIGFDTEIVLGGDPTARDDDLYAALARMSDDDLTAARLFERVTASLWPGSRCEWKILRWFDHHSPEWNYLQARLTPINEHHGPRLTVLDDTVRVCLTNGFLRRPDGTLCEYTIPGLGSAPEPGLRPVLV